jgi:hypothetical protein
MKYGLFSRLKHLFIPVLGNDYRPRLLRRQALTVIVLAVVLVEGLMVVQIVANTYSDTFFAAVLPASIEAFTNDERAALSLSPLSENQILQRAAQRKAEDMASKGYFSHQSPDGRAPWDFMKAAGYNYRHAGENLAIHFYDSADVVSAWMASPTHRANIVKPVYTEIGIGIATGLYEGKQTTFVVQFFGSPKTAAAASQPAVEATLPVPSPAPSVSQAAVAGDSVTAAPASLVARIMGSPRSTAVWVLSSFAALLLVGMLLTFVIKIQVQPLDLLANGTLAVAFIAGLLILNDQFFTSSLKLTQQAAATVQAIEPVPSI